MGLFQAVQVILLQISLLFFVSVFRVFIFFSLNCSLDFIGTVFLTDSDVDARASYQEISGNFHFATAVLM